MNSLLHVGEVSETLLTCQYCQWTGLGDETDTSIVYGDIQEIYCPSCAEVIALVKYPSISMSSDIQCVLMHHTPISHINTGPVDGNPHI